MGPVRQYAAEPSDEPVTLRVYPGADGRFSWYQDDGISFAYQHGHFLKIDCFWENATRKLTLTQSGRSDASVVTKILVRPMDTDKSKTAHLKDPLTVIDM